VARITGIGGVFFKSRHDNKALAHWYSEHLGMRLEDFGGAVLRWPEDKAEDNGVTAWHIADKESKWFSPSSSEFMINYRVDNLDEMIDQLKRSDVKILKGPESHENGKFAWIIDPDGNKVELWEPMRWDAKNKRP
jgi:predicted enzyme related to lactoylglutathione lyase